MRDSGALTELLLTRLKRPKNPLIHESPENLAPIETDEKPC